MEPCRKPTRGSALHPVKGKIDPAGDHCTVLRWLYLDERAEKLTLVELCVESSLFEQLSVCAPLYDLPLVHDEDQIGVLNRRESVGDDEARSSLHQVVHRFLDGDLGERVDVACGFVQYEHVWIGQEGPCNGYELLFTVRYVRCLFVDHGVVSIRQGHDEVVRLRHLRSPYDFLLCGVLFSVGYVLPYRAVEQPRVLQDHAEAPPQIVLVDVPDVYPIEFDAAFLYFVEPHQQIDQRGLSGTGWADNCNPLAAEDFDVQVLYEGFLGDVAEGDVLEPDVSLRLFNPQRVWFFGFFFLFIEDVEHPLRRCNRRLDEVDNVGDLHDGLCELLGVLDEGLNVANGDDPLRDEDASHHRDDHIAQIAYEPRQRHDHAGQKLCLVTRIAELLVYALEPLDHILFSAVRLHNDVPGVNFLYVPAQFSKLLLLPQEEPLGVSRDDGCRHDTQRQRKRRNPCEERVYREHHDRDACHGNYPGDELNEALLERVADEVDVIDHPAQDLTVGSRVVESQR